MQGEDCWESGVRPDISLARGTTEEVGGSISKTGIRGESKERYESAASRELSVIDGDVVAVVLVTDTNIVVAEEVAVKLEGMEVLVKGSRGLVGILPRRVAVIVGKWETEVEVVTGLMAVGRYITGAGGITDS